jgi:glycosyltransferase involved in cell wall biosynthesis
VVDCLRVDVAIVAPCPVPYVIGGAENLWRGLQDHLNEHTPHQAEIIKLPSREHAFFDLVDSYRRFAELDLTGFDVVVSGKYPAWMVSHPRHVCYMLHPLRGLYDTYHFFGLPDVAEDGPAPVRELRAFMATHAGERAALDELFARVDALRGGPGDFSFPGPLIREIVHFLDGIAFAPGAIRAYGAISAAVRDRPGYFPAGAPVFVAHPPGRVPPARARRGRYLLSAGRLDGAKRIDLLIAALAHAGDDVELRIAGTGPEEAALRELAAGDPRVTLLGRVSDAELAELYARCRAVAFIPYEEDFGLVALEAMALGKPVITCTDSGGPRELVQDGVTGFVADPQPEAIGAAIRSLWSGRALRTQMGRAAAERARAVTWDPVVTALEAAAA